MMGKNTSKSLRLGLPILVFGASAGSLFGQAPIELHTLQPKSPSQNGPTYSLPTASRIPEPAGIIKLEKFPQIENAAKPRLTSAPLSVVPLKQEIVSPRALQDNSRGARLNVDEMVRSQVNISRVFSQLRLDSTQSITPAPFAPTVRIQNSAGMGEFEWTPSGYNWQSPAFCYSPLYFEQPNLERYGNSTFPFLAPVVSATYFFGQATLLPITSLHKHPWSKSCTLGHHRPGDCAPFQRRNPNHVPATPTISSQAMYSSDETFTVTQSTGTNAVVDPNQVQMMQQEAGPMNAVLPGAEPVMVKLSD